MLVCGGCSVDRGHTRMDGCREREVVRVGEVWEMMERVGAVVARARGFVRERGEEAMESVVRGDEGRWGEVREEF